MYIKGNFEIMVPSFLCTSVYNFDAVFHTGFVCQLISGRPDLQYTLGAILQENMGFISLQFPIINFAQPKNGAKLNFE